VNRRTITAFALLTLVAGGARAQTPAAPEPERQSKALNLTAYAELLRSDVRAQKVAILTEVMGFTDKEDAAFWPIYREYDLEMAKLGDERTALIAEYARNYTSLTDDAADSLVTRALDLETRRQAAKTKCYNRADRLRGAAPEERACARALPAAHRVVARRGARSTRAAGRHVAGLGPARRISDLVSGRAVDARDRDRVELRDGARNGTRRSARGAAGRRVCADLPAQARGQCVNAGRVTAG
jgi:hypothetical protein